MNKGKSTQQISIRLSAQDHQRLVMEAERKGTTVADIARQKIQMAEKQIEMRELLSSVVNHLTNHMYVITSTVAGLDPDEQETTRASIESKLKRKLK